MEPKILIGCPTSEAKRYCITQYIQAIKKLTYQNKELWIIDNSETKGYYELLKKNGINTIKDKFIPNTRERTVQSRNILRQKVLEENFDYFLSLEQDTIPPPNIIENLLAHKKEIISGVYYEIYYKNKIPTLYPLIWEKINIDKEAMRFMTTECKKGKESKTPILKEIKACGLGCVLISKKVLQQIKFKTNPPVPFENIQFCKEAEQKGFKIYADLSIHCERLRKTI